MVFKSVEFLRNRFYGLLFNACAMGKQLTIPQAGSNNKGHATICICDISSSQALGHVPLGHLTVGTNNRCRPPKNG